MRPILLIIVSLIACNNSTKKIEADNIEITFHDIGSTTINTKERIDVLLEVLSGNSEKITCRPNGFIVFKNAGRTVKEYDFAEHGDCQFLIS